jgi:hypothetical protein
MTVSDLFENLLTLKRTVWSKRGDRVVRREVEKASAPVRAPEKKPEGKKNA